MAKLTNWQKNVLTLGLTYLIKFLTKVISKEEKTHE